MAFFDRLRRLLPGAAPSGPFERAARALERGRLEEAETELAAALGAARTAAEVAAVHNKRAVLAVHRHDLRRAVDALVEALEADPRSAAAITTLGNLLLEHGDVAEAIAHFEYALLIDDQYAPAYHNLGVALHRSGRRGEAVRMLRKATRLESRIRRT
ncbi:MAG: tetratricopeptide repeat protein [Candidatus Eremiobacteraeota bacterium]|nr:tetratricopeptide repeat protein [Candidatus Eremiobacteraeota bacterium]